MKPTEEQLKDPKWWDENAPEGAEALIEGTWAKWAEGVAMKYSDGNKAWVKFYTYGDLKYHIESEDYTVYTRPKPAWQPKMGEVCLARCNGHFIPAEPLKKTELGNWVCLTTNEMTVFITDGVKPLPKTPREKFVEKAANQFGYRADDLAALYDLAMEFK